MGKKMKKGDILTHKTTELVFEVGDTVEYKGEEGTVERVRTDIVNSIGVRLSDGNLRDIKPDNLTLVSSFTVTNNPIDIAALGPFKNSGSRKTRLLKVLSLPIALLILLPVIILQSCIWIVKGKRTPGDVIQSYLDWL